MKLSTVFIPLAFFAASALGYRVQFYTVTSCAGGASEDYQNLACNTCVDPPGDWSAVQLSQLGGNNRVSIHNEDQCTSGSQVGQGYGDSCFGRGGTPIRSAWLACPGQEALVKNATVVSAPAEPNV